MRSNSQNSISNVINCNNLKNSATVCTLILFLLCEIIIWPVVNFWTTVYWRTLDESWNRFWTRSFFDQDKSSPRGHKRSKNYYTWLTFFSIYISNFGSPSLALLSHGSFFITSCWCKLEIVLLSFISFLVVLYLLW